jgi:hypothetical protein
VLESDAQGGRLPGPTLKLIEVPEIVIPPSPESVRSDCREVKLPVDAAVEKSEASLVSAVDVDPLCWLARLVNWVAMLLMMLVKADGSFWCRLLSSLNSFELLEKLVVAAGPVLPAPEVELLPVVECDANCPNASRRDEVDAEDEIAETLLIFFSPVVMLLESNC